MTLTQIQESESSTEVKMNADAVFQTKLNLPNRRQGKVRDIYDLPADDSNPARLLIIASDRISAFDVVIPTAIPGKGRILTEISTHWFDFIRKNSIVSDHLLSTNVNDIPGISASERKPLTGRIMICRAARVIPVECVVRGYLAGSGWVEYQKNQTVCGIKLPAGLKQCDKLPEPIFTPATKATEGHDENISFEKSCEIAGRDAMTKCRDISIRIYSTAAEYARKRGIILADTKFEFGFALDSAGKPTNELLLVDEVLTPDSSRFWPAEEYEPGRDQHSFDKQYVRNHLLELVKQDKWHKQPPAPELPANVVKNTVARYIEARDRLFAQ